MSGLATRAGRLLGYDGRIAGWLLAIWQCFLAGASFTATLAPLLAFQALVGWQPTHLAIALFGAAALPVVPGVFGLLVAAERILDLGVAARAGSAFWRSFREGAVRMRAVAVAGALAAVALSYHAALSAGSGGALLAAVVLSVAVTTVLIATCVVAIVSPRRGLALVVEATAAAARRPHIALAWLLLIAVGLASAAVPVLGPSLMIFAPVLVALGVHICNRALGFGRRTEEENL